MSGILICKVIENNLRENGAPCVPPDVILLALALLYILYLFREERLFVSRVSG